MHFVDCWVNMTEDLHTTETQGLTQERHATSGVDKCRLDDLAQRKCVEIHEVLSGNKWMGSLDLTI